MMRNTLNIKNTRNIHPTKTKKMLKLRIKRKLIQNLMMLHLQNKCIRFILTNVLSFDKKLLNQIEKL